MEAARLAAERYVTAVNDADIELMMSLFAEGATVRNPFGHFENHEAIRNFYENFVFRSQARLTLTHLLAGEGCAMAEMYAESPLRPDHRQWASDVFEVDADGRIEKLSIYYLELPGGATSD